MAKCTSCSAPLPAHETICAYCGVRNNVDLRGIHEYTLAAPQTDRTCPRCAVALQTINVRTEGTFLIEQCPECFGLFFDPGELEAVLESTVTHVFEIDHKRLDAIVATRGQRPVQYGKCPVCTTLMNRVNCGSRSGVVANRCKNHGVWLDGGELRQLLEWRKAGGQLLHEQLRAEREKEEEKQRRDKAALEQALMQQGGASGGGWSAGETELGAPLDLARLLLGLVDRLFR